MAESNEQRPQRLLTAEKLQNILAYAASSAGYVIDYNQHGLQRTENSVTTSVQGLNLKGPASEKIEFPSINASVSRGDTQNDFRFSLSFNKGGYIAVGAIGPDGTVTNELRTPPQSADHQKVATYFLQGLEAHQNGITADLKAKAATTRAPAQQPAGSYKELQAPH